MSLPERIEAKISRASDTSCWVWTGSRNPKGYGTCYPWNGQSLVHRGVFVELVGPIPEGLQLDHLCRNRACVNPDHLEPVPARTNQLRGFGEGGRNARKTHCPLGHPYDEKNTRISRDGRRACRACTCAGGAGRTRTLEIISQGVS